MKKKTRNSLVIIVVLVVIVLATVMGYRRYRKSMMVPEEYWPIEALLAGEVELGIPPPQKPTVEPEKKYRVAKDFEYKGEWSKAIEAYREAIKEYPNSEWAPYGQCTIGTFYHILKDERQAIKEYEKVVSNYSATSWAPYAQFRIGDRYRNLKDFRQAMEAYRKLVKEYPNCHPVVKENARRWAAALKKGIQ